MCESSVPESEAYLKGVCLRPAHSPTGINIEFFPSRRLLRVTTLPLALTLITGIEAYLKGVCLRPHCQCRGGGRVASLGEIPGIYASRPVSEVRGKRLVNAR